MDERDADHPPFDGNDKGYPPDTDDVGHPPDANDAGRPAQEPDDPALWAPVKAAPVPPPNPSFMTNLMARLDDADAEARPVAARPARRWGWGGRRLRLAVAAAAAAAFALGIVFVTLPGNEHGGQAPSIAAARVKLDQAMASTKTLQGELVIAGATAPQAHESSAQFVALGEAEPVLAEASPSPVAETRLSFVLTAQGDLRIEGGDAAQGSHFVTTLDSRSNTVCELVERPGAASSYTVYSGDNDLPGSPSDPFARLNHMLGSYVRGILDQGAPGFNVTDVTYQGRAAWELTGPAPEPEPAATAQPSATSALQDLAIVIDKQTGIPVRLASSHDGIVTREERLENLVFDAPQAESLFTQSPPTGAVTTMIDRGYRQGTLGWAARKMDYRPLIPTLLPAGYHLAAVVCQAKRPWSSSAGSQASADRGLTLVYRRGFDTFVVATHALGGQVKTWGGSDGIMAVGADGSSQSVTLTAGQLAGSTAQISVTYEKPPMLIVRMGEREVLIDGDLTSSELLQVANSLTEWSP